MKKFWTGVARFFAFILSILFALAAILVVLLNDIDRRLLAPTPARNVLAQLILRLSPDLPLILLILISFLAVRTPKGWLRWWGIPFFFTGLFSVGLGISLSVVFVQVWLTIQAHPIPAPYTMGILNLSKETLRALLLSFVPNLTIGGIALLLLGLVMWIVSGLIKKKPEPAAAVEALPPAA